MYIENYTEHNEKLLRDWLKLSQEKAIKHHSKGKIFKLKHELFGLPIVLLPLISTPITTLIPNEHREILTATILVSTGVFNGIYIFYDFGRKSQKHFDYEAKYSDLATTIQVELAKETHTRIHAARFIEMIQSKIDNYGENEPLL